ncbi:MAG TPA: phosphate acyltransferase PlsX [Bacteroidales bacterium]|jgi:glycerol-3-phosphate acyltransferase PlsX|nr:phosphate acyltransferase PlsX [Bacteroidales bacterium]HOU98915.1 phosphate acyltransferase PlsX [Bacteroidales bacterium]
MKLGIDIMGGDYAPLVSLQGTVMALEQLPNDVTVVLFGDAQKIQSYLNENHISDSRIEIVPTSEVIEMHESPAQAFVQKQNSSIFVGFQYLKAEKINCFASAGSTGAMMVGAMQVIKVIEGIIRPCIASFIPKPDGNFSIIADVGLNPDAKPDVLNQYAIIASKYAQFVLGVEKPKVALLNIGEEPEKGNLLAKATYELMKENESINFIGNVEGFDILKNKADVIITDGFVGNIVLKMAEGFYSAMKKRDINDEYIHKFNFENYGGTPVLGVNKPIIIGHGASTAKAIMNMILLTYKVTKAELVQKLKEAF